MTTTTDPTKGVLPEAEVRAYARDACGQYDPTEAALVLVRRIAARAAELARGEQREQHALLAERWAHELAFNPAALPVTAGYLRDFAAAIRKGGSDGR